MYTLGAAIDAAVYRGFWQNAYRGTAVFGEKYRGLIRSMVYRSHDLSPPITAQYTAEA